MRHQLVTMYLKLLFYYHEICRHHYMTDMKYICTVNIRSPNHTPYFALQQMESQFLCTVFILIGLHALIVEDTGLLLRLQNDLCHIHVLYTKFMKFTIIYIYTCVSFKLCEEIAIFNRYMRQTNYDFLQSQHLNRN